MNISRALVALAGFVLLCLVIARPAHMHGTSGEAVFDNHPPTAVNDSYSVHGTLVVPGPGILANDTDPDSDILHIGSCGSVAHGTRTCTSTSFTYTANYGYVGSDSFAYQSCDGYGACASGTVTLTVTNGAPVAVNDSFTMHGDTFFLSGPNALRQNDSDPEGDPFSVASYTQTSHGTVTYSYTYGSLRYELTNPWYSGTDSFNYTICDNLGACSTATATFNVVESAPTPVSDFFVTHDTLTVPGPNALRANDSDPDNDPISIYSVSSAAHGTTSYSHSSGGLTTFETKFFRTNQRAFFVESQPPKWIMLYLDPRAATEP